MVNQVFNEENLHVLKGDLAIGHTRYSTTGSVRLTNAQPYLIETSLGPLAIAHNGNLTNTNILRRDLLQRGVGLSQVLIVRLSPRCFLVQVGMRGINGLRILWEKQKAHILWLS